MGMKEWKSEKHLEISQNRFWLLLIKKLKEKNKLKMTIDLHI